MNNNGANGFFTVRNVLLGLAILSLTIVFLPAFVMRSYGEYYFVSDFSFMVGRSALFVDRIGNSFPLGIFPLLIGIGMVVIPFIRAINNKITAIIMLALAGTDLIMLIVLAIAGWSRYRYMSKFRISGFLILDFVLILLIVAIAVLLLLGRTVLDSQFTDIFTKGAGRKVFDTVTNAVDRATDSVFEGVSDAPRKEYIGFCAKCGNKIVYGSTFCSVCGTAVPASVLEEGELIHKENVKRAEEEAIRKEEQRRAAEAERARREEERRAAQEAAHAEAERRAVQRAQMEEERRAAAMQQREAAMQQRAAAMQQREAARAAAMQQRAAAQNVAPVVAPNPTMQPQGRAMFCQQCGTKAVPDSMFCENCGSKLV